MKKITLLLLLISLLNNSNATVRLNSFQKHLKNNSYSKVQRPKNSIQKLSTNLNVPTLTKNSYWNFLNSNWDPESAVRKVYQNDLLKFEFETNYQLNDTFSRKEYTYDANKYLTLYLHSIKDFNGIFRPSNRTTYTYFNNYLKIVRTEEYYDSQSQTWVPSGRYTNEFNSRGDEIAGIQESFINGIWKIEYAFQNVYTYLNNTNNKFTECISSDYDTVSKTYIASYKDVINYNSNEQGVEWISYDYIAGSGFVPSFLDSIFYTNNIATSIIEYGYNQNVNSFYKDLKFDGIVWEYFDPNSNLFSNDEVFAYNISNWLGNSWVLVERLTTSFPDNYGSKIKLYEEFLNNNWAPTYKNTYMFDSRKNQTEESYSDFNSQTNSWIITYGDRKSFQYDVNNNITESIQEYYNSSVQAWEKFTKKEHSNYITISVGIKTDLNIINANIYPNPSENGLVYINVKLDQSSELLIKVIDLNGKLIYSKSADYNNGLNTICLQNLNKGLFIVEIISEYGSYKSKLIVN